MKSPPFSASGMVLSLLLGLMLSAPDVGAQAFCAIRNPNRIIQGFFEKGCTVRSFQRTISRKVAQECNRQAEVSFDPREYGKHTLYAVSLKGELAGYVMARTEIADYGLAEIVWKLSPDLRVQEFAFQRCRSPHRDDLMASGFQARLADATLEDLVAMRDESVMADLLRSLGLEPRSKALVRATLESAIKTILLTRIAFASDLQ